LEPDEGDADASQESEQEGGLPQKIPPVAVYPPQTIICVPVQMAVCLERAMGQSLPTDVTVQVSDAGRYRPPVLV
jgi:hypothetical protein